MRFRPLLIAIACLALAAPLALAQTTGSISGTVRDGQGGPLPGVTVTVSSPNMPLGRTTTSQGDGTFQFFGLLPGIYHLKAELSGMGAFDQEVVVSIQKETQVRASLRATATAEVTVTAATPVVDTKSTTVSSVTDRAAIEKLPLARTFAGTMALAPGVAESGVAISNTNPGFNAGGGRQDNQFLYDGVNVTNPFFADLFQDFAELDIQEVNITRAGVSPEYGRTGGFIVNGVTKSGTNAFHGEARLEYEPSSLGAKSKDPNNTSVVNRVRPGASIGGPVVPDRLFFYGSGNFYRQAEKERFNNFNIGGTPNPLPNSDLDINEYFAKLTATPLSNQLLEASFRYRGVKQTNTDIGTRGAASTGDNPKEIDRIGVASWFWTVSSRFNLEAKYNHNENHNGASPSLAFGYQPAFNAANPAAVGLFTDPLTGQQTGGASLAINNDDFFRDEYKLTASYLASVFGASHDFRIGGSYSANREELARIANGWGSISVSSSSNCGPAAARPCFRARYSPDQPAQVSKARTYGLFAQDQMTWNYLTVNLGVLVNRDQYIPSGGTFIFERGDFRIPNSLVTDCVPGTAAAACTYRDTLTIPWSKQFQPRVGISYEIDHNAHDKVYANFARYDNLDNQSIARSASPIRLFRTDAYFNRTTGALVTQVTRSNQNNGKRVIPNIDPTFTDEYLVGYARPLGQGFSFEGYGIYRRTRDVIEDFPATGNNFVDLNPNNFRYGNIAAKRRYRGATVQLRKTGANDRWSADLSYTLSRLDGNWDLDYATQLFYSSSYLEDGPGINVEDQFRQGVLEGDRTHVAKLFGSYNLPTNTIIGGYLRFQSGRPWQAQQYDPVYGVPYQYIEPAGSRRLSSWTNFDLLVAQNIPLGTFANFRIEGRLLNVFNSQPALSVDKTLYSSDSNTTLNPNFGHALTYAPARRFLATGTFSF